MRRLSASSRGAMLEDSMQIGDIVRYKNENTPFGTIVWIMPKEERKDNVLVMWSKNRKWFVWPENIEVVNERAA